ncbi:MAG: DUF4221 family protein [Mongoliitalea sp.]
MKYTLAINLLILVLFLSCETKQQAVSDFSLSFQSDTVMIDSKGRNFDLTRNLAISDLSPEKASIYLINKFDNAIDEISLDRQEYSKSILLEKDGPNGISYISNIYVLKDHLFFIKAFEQSAVFDSNGKKIKKTDWSKVGIENDALMHKNELALEFSDTMRVFGLPYGNDRSLTLEVLSTKENTRNRFDVDLSKSYENNILELDGSGTYFFLEPTVYLKSENGLVIISHDFTSELYIFSAAGKLLRHLDYKPALTPKAVKQLDKKSIATVDELKNAYQGFLEQVKFSPPVWDEVNKVYLRLSAIKIFTDILEAGDFLPKVQETKVFLTIFDGDFNIVKEGEIQELSSESMKYFAKDGKLWVFSNFHDELGFIRLSIDY